MYSLEEIRTGFEANEFILEYLPTISLSNQSCVGAEALIRWRRADQVVPPLEFVPQIESSPLSGPMTYWIIERVAMELGDWLREQEGVHISINVPPELFGRGGLHYAVQKSNLSDVSNKLMMEVTERGLPDAMGIAAIADARRAGVLVALDDLNMNETNIVVLSRIHTDVVKFDKSFADQMLQPDWKPEDIEGLSALITSTCFKVLVEGIETARQADIVKDAGVHLAQGFFFSPPLPAPRFMEYFSAHQQDALA
jgi:sensor c-di-GMP phosphodiesterase-like protein